MLKRIISALLAIPLLFFVVFKNGILIRFFVPILALIGINEFFNAFRNTEINPSKSIAILSILGIFLLTLKTVTTEIVLLWLFISTIFILISNIFKQNFDIISLGVTAIGIYYIVFFMYHIVFIINYGKYPQLIWLVFISAWATDTFAYFVGNFLGSKKLCPHISPKKTIEGAIGGVLGSTIISTGFAYFIMPEIIFHCILIGCLGSIFGQMGDLVASIFKRYTGIKDYGKIMPGHGGILDRFDSILFTAPTVYYYMVLIIQ